MILSPRVIDDCVCVFFFYRQLLCLDRLKSNEENLFILPHVSFRTIWFDNQLRLAAADGRPWSARLMCARRGGRFVSLCSFRAGYLSVCRRARRKQLLMGISDRQRKRTRDKAAQMSERRLEAESVRKTALFLGSWGLFLQGGGGSAVTVRLPPRSVTDRRFVRVFVCDKPYCRQ